jgi:hypothetical protein
LAKKKVAAGFSLRKGRPFWPKRLTQPKGCGYRKNFIKETDELETQNSKLFKAVPHGPVAHHKNMKE